MVSPGDAALTAAWIDWPGRTIMVVAAPDRAGKPSTAAPAARTIATTRTRARPAIAASPHRRPAQPGAGPTRPPRIKVNSRPPCSLLLPIQAKVPKPGMLAKGLSLAFIPVADRCHSRHRRTVVMDSRSDPVRRQRVLSIPGPADRVQCCGSGINQPVVSGPAGFDDAHPAGVGHYLV